ncbi:heparinase II/III family protein [uncultured Psychrobacter sp.]|uniref:heparinase II/III domain-containing protein n=1 Tax=uncultured Psychrobacter sp. TaxID=259303 RepID=UPI003457B978
MKISYENLTGQKESKQEAILEAYKILEEGWSQRNYSSININDPIPWALNSQDERSWNFHIHSWDMIDTLLYAYNESLEENLFKPALNIALDWIERYVDRQTDTPIDYQDSTDFAWYDMAVGLRAYRLAYIYDVYKQKLKDDDLTSKKLWSGLLAHQAYLNLDSNIIFHNNHGYYQAAGQIAMGRRFKDTSSTMALALEQGISRFKIMLNQQFTEEGVHREHSPDYHRMVYDTLIGVIKANLIKDDDILAFTYKIEEALSWFILPSQYIANFGDSDWRSMYLKSSTADKKWQTPMMKFVTTNGEIGKLGDDSLKVFEEAGYFVVRSNDSSKNTSYERYSYLAQTAAFHSRTHKHADDLSFIWYDRGHNILIDAGRYGYIGKAEIGSDLWKQGYWYTHPNRLYCESTRAHNTLEFDNNDYVRKSVKPYGSATKRSKQYSNGLTVIETECKHNKSIRHARVLIYMPNQWLIVFDWFKDNLDGIHDVKQWFNFDPKIKLIRSNNGYCTKLDNNTELHIASLLSGVQGSNVMRGVEGPRLQGWFSPAEREFVPSDSVNFSLSQVNTSAFATLLSFNGKVSIDANKNQVNISGRRFSLNWQDSLGKHSLIIRREKDEPDLLCQYDI